MNDLRTLSSQSYRIIALALLTALIHLFLGVRDGFVIFIPNGLGFIGAGRRSLSPTSTGQLENSRSLGIDSLHGDYDCRLLCGQPTPL